MHRLPEWIQDRIEPEPNTGCWLWTGRPTARGYGQVKVNKRCHRAHRYVYELLVGPITKPCLDHICRVRACVNPKHLRPATIAENVHAPGSMAPQALNRAKTHCKCGHVLVARKNGKAKGSRRCPACDRRDSLARYYRRKSAGHQTTAPNDSLNAGTNLVG